MENSGNKVAVVVLLDTLMSVFSVGFMLTFLTIKYWFSLAVLSLAAHGTTVNSVIRSLNCPRTPDDYEIVPLYVEFFQS